MKRLFAFLVGLLYAAQAYAFTPLQVYQALQPPPFVGNVNGSQIAGLPLPQTDINFITSRAYNNGLWGTPQNFVVTSRGSPATISDNSGNYVQVPANATRWSNLGTLPEEQRTNSIRNNTMQGAVVGTARTISGITGLSRVASASAVLLCSTCNAAANDLITISGASVSTYNGTWLVTAAVANTSITFTTATSTTDSATGETVSAVSPGTLPTDWINGLPAAGIGYTIVGTGTESGINYVDIQFAGAATSTFNVQTFFDSNTQVAALYGQTWTASVFVYETVSTLPPDSATLGLIGYNGATLEESYSGSVTLGSGPLGQSRNTLSHGLTNASTTSVILNVALHFTSGTAYNYTIRFGASQLEQNSNINSTVSSATVNAGGSGGTNGTNVNLTVTGGTCSTQPVIQGTISGNALTAITGYGTPGACTVFPPSPATVTGNSLSGASVNLAPTNNAASAFATSPILTSGSAATRYADNLTVNSVPVNRAAGAWIYGSGTPNAPTIYPNSQMVVSLDDGTTNNRLQLTRGGLGASFDAIMYSGGTQEYNQNSGTWAQSAFGKMSLTSAAGAQNAAYDGTALTSGTGTPNPATLNTLHIGERADDALQFNGYIERIAVGTGQIGNAVQQLTLGSSP